ncbi:MAG TPA: hypothetical protein VF731_13135 [Solirubrobacterales bacterium]
MRRAALISASCAALLALAGCGGAEGVSSGATVSVYAAASLCAGAQRGLAEAGSAAGSVRVRVLCLEPERSGGRLRLATVGANARRATEDSSAVAYLEASDPAANRFAEPILESADLGWSEARSGAAGVRRVLRAIAAAGTGSVREAVREALEAS